jgi:hypothetical protein
MWRRHDASLPFFQSWSEPPRGAGGDELIFQILLTREVMGGAGGSNDRVQVVDAGRRSSAHLSLHFGPGELQDVACFHHGDEPLEVMLDQLW